MLTSRPRKRATLVAPPFYKAIKKAAYEEAIARIQVAEEENNGQLPYGFMNTLLSDLRASGITDATRDVVNFHRTKMKKFASNSFTLSQPRAPVNTVFIPGSGTEQSSLTISTQSDTNNNGVSLRKSGRPKGTTNISKRETKTNVEDCLAAVVQELSEARKERHDKGGCRTQKGLLDQIIKKQKEVFGLDDSVEIKHRTVWERLRRNILQPVRKPGPKSPLAELEDTIIDIAIQMCRCRQPLTTSEGLVLVNSLIKGTKYETMVSEFQTKNCGGTIKNTTTKGEVGESYWSAFMKRNQHRIVNKRGEKFASSRADWSTYENFEKMYDHIYDEMVSAGIAVPLPSAVCMDSHGNVVDSQSSTAFGLPVEYSLAHPDHLLFLDEMGIDTNQKKDGHVGGEKFICEPGTRPKIGVSTTDHRCTVIPLVAANGDAVCCVVIFTGESDCPPVDWCMGRDITVDPECGPDGQVVFSEINQGPGKYFPGGPTCRF